VTHGLSFLKNVDRIVVIKDGKISEMGTYIELMANRGAFAEFLETYLQEKIIEEPEEITDEGC
jgi:ABC-type multidrug transport system fused ATPase/permease subunit